MFPNITRQVAALSAAAGLFEGLHAGCAHSSVSPNTDRHVQGDVAAAAITTSVAGARISGALNFRPEEEQANDQSGDDVEKLARDAVQAVKRMKVARLRRASGG